MNLTVCDIENMANNGDMQEATKAVFLAMAYEQTVRPIVEKYQAEVLESIQGINQYDGSIIVLPKHAYCLSDEDFKVYLHQINIKREEAGFNVPTPDHCPLLIAERFTRDAKHVMIETAEQFTKLTLDSLTCQMKLYNLYVELLLSLMSKHITINHEHISV